MPIELKCPGCQRTLRVGDENAGKTAKCPACQTTMTVPGALDAPLASPLPSAFSDPPVLKKPFEKPKESIRDPLNPYASPATTESEHFADGEMVHTQVAFDELLRLPWTIFQANLGTLAVLGGVMFGVYAALGLVGVVLQVATATEPTLGMVSSMLMNIVQFLAQSILGIAGVNYCLKLLRQGRVDFGEIANIGPFVGSALLKDFLIKLVPGLLFGAFVFAVFGSFAFVARGRPEPPSSLVMIAFIVGLVVFAVAMLLVTIYFFLSGPLIVDRRLGAIQSLSTSWRFVSGNFLSILGSGFITLLLGGIFSVCTCYLGFILFMPYLTVYTCVCYFLMTGQRHAIAPQALGQASKYYQ